MSAALAPAPPAPTLKIKLPERVVRSPRLASRCGPVIAMRSAGRLVPIGGRAYCADLATA
ncbi:MAG: hypothetical protein QOF76_811 [Solirubrobacteraceae bacterium]|jgi:hypothetical protein|nr:hypothetical protein [Solirubrobacteraceae bacterium]